MTIKLVPIDFKDVNFLDKTEYKDLPLAKREELIKDSILGEKDGKVFKFCIIKIDDSAVGVINFCGHSKRVFSVAPYILEEYRNKGYAFLSLRYCYKKEKKHGYKTVVADIVEDNIKRQNLHLKLGFEYIRSYKSKSGKDLRLYIKNL